ncbi:ribonuclease [Skermania sp. ID1734]|uniref:ribonuclease domain-containing protein n=1 Tax=Skermania sp. ID1734 TaxID=2597516 RepID=UPI00117E11A5|nr:ribonuclease domain-containing protein [Skermania sp. ID1734]TSE02057.1 ribonuclease [Skermania sp. ID1734]
MRRRGLAALRAAATAVVALIVVLLVAFHGGSHSAPAASALAPRAATTAPGVPAQAYTTLRLIDAGDWPAAAHAPGTKGGDTWRNSGGDLPRKTSAGVAISYREWDVNAKQRGRTRDAERIVTGSDGSAWYTGDHYRTFTRMR